MIQINTEHRYRVVLDEVDEVLITLVGVGGTGSALAIDLARLVYHARGMGQGVRLQLVDGDHVEAKNVGRQQFGECEIGENKAVSMAQRLSEWLGLEIVATPNPWKLDDAPLISGSYSHRRILVGAVDNAEARQVLNHLQQKLGCWWVDVGNDEMSGQLLVGNKSIIDQVELDNKLGLANGLPSPAVQRPGLLVKRVGEVPATDCALGMLRGDQSLNVNRMMAVHAAQAVYALVMEREIGYMRTEMSLAPPGASSTFITQSVLNSLGSACNQ